MSYTSKVALFLGAGASRVFNYPTTKEFLAGLKPKLDNNQKNIVDTFEESEKVVDIEHILQMLDVFTNLKSNSLVNECLKKRPPTFPFVRGGIDWRTFDPACEGIKKKAYSELFARYQFNIDNISDIVLFYGRLFTDLAHFNENYRLDIFTTNYDSVVEEFYNNSVRLDIVFIDGFMPVGRSGSLLWRPEKTFPKNFPKGPLNIRLFKLHGSLNWSERNDGEIQKVTIEQQVADSQRHKRNVLIALAQKTYEQEKPFGKLFEYFRGASKTSRIFVVIGFSFRDDLINGIFLDHLRANRKGRLVAVSPNATEHVEENLIGGENRLKKQIICIDKYFGEEETFEAIIEALSSKPKEKEEEEEP